MALDFVLFKDDSSEWQVSIEWTNGGVDTDISYKTYNEALAEYNRWGY